jgi:uncharacterized membrane protein YgdD (TMEM256/DUF423 family)
MFAFGDAASAWDWRRPRARLSFIISFTPSRCSFSRFTEQTIAARGGCFFAGIFLFSGSLYVIALIPQLRDWLGAVTPFGGLCFLAGWAWLIIAPR